MGDFVGECLVGHLPDACTQGAEFGELRIEFVGADHNLGAGEPGGEDESQEIAECVVVANVNVQRLDEWAVAEHVGFGNECGAVVFHAEFVTPCHGVKFGGAPQPGAVVVSERSTEAAFQVPEEACNGGVDADVGADGQVAVGPGALLSHVVGSASFGTGANGRVFPPAEGLTFHNRTGDTTVDVGVADFNAVAPVGDFFFVEGV